MDALVPGIEPEDIDLNVMKGTLTISGERQESESSGRTWHRRGRGGGTFLRSIELPVAVNTEKVDAHYTNGILSVALAKAQEVKPKKIAVKTL